MKTLKHLLLFCSSLFVFQTAQAQISADFSYDLIDVCNVWEVGFVDQSGTSQMAAQYLWDFGDNSSSSAQNPIHNYSNGGTYQVTHTVFLNGSTYTNVETISFNAISANVEFTASVSSVNCTGPYVISLSAGGNPNNSSVYEWYGLNQVVGSSQNLNYTVTTPGTYTISLLYTDSLSTCPSVYDSTIIIDSGIQALVDATPSSACAQSCDGNIFANATGGAGPYTFSMGSGNTMTGYQVVFDSLCPGTYDINVSDTNGCTTIISTTVGADSVSGVFVNAVVNNGNSCDTTTVCSGSIDAVATNGTPPYQYSIDFGATYQNNGSFSGLCPGTYIVMVVDDLGCIGEYTTVLNGAQALGVQYSLNFASCDSSSNTPGGGNSFISVFPYGGAPPYAYSWSDGSTSSTVSNPSAGTYTVIVTDANTCTYSETFTVPNNECYTISGNVYVDVNQNCVYDSTDYAVSCFVDLTASAGGPWLWIYDYTGGNGFYSIDAPAGTYFFDVNGSNVTNFTSLCPNANYSVTINANNPNATVDFFLAPPPPSQDLSINMYTPYTFTPGFPTYTTVQYCNDGTIPMSGNVVVEYDASLVWYQSGTTPSGNSISNNDVPSSHDAVNQILTYNFSNLLPGQCNYLDVDYETPIGTGLMPGDPILIDASVNPIPGDVTPANNQAYLSKFITSSWDPNDKAVSPDGDITVDQNDHAYYIRFQNEGNGNATTVVIRDEIDVNLALHSLKNVSASHDYILTVENDNVLVFTFNNIQLVPQSVSETLSQGFVAFTLSQDGSLPIGTVINNTAEIFFDFNPAIVTNTVENEIVEKVTGITNRKIENLLKVYPNPSSGIYQISLGGLEIYNLRVYDLIGNVLLQAEGVNNKNTQINLSNQLNGVYFVEVETASGKAVHKLIKQVK